VTRKQVNETQPQQGQRPAAPLQHRQLVGKRVMVVSPEGERLPAVVGPYHGAENGFELKLNDAGGYQDGLSAHMARRGWKIPNIQVQNVKAQTLAGMARRMGEAVNERRKAQPPGHLINLEPIGDRYPYTREPMSQNPDPKKRQDYLNKRRKASAMRQSVAHESAEQVVSAMLDEDFAYGGDGREEFEKRAGGAKDPWRQGSLGKFSFKGKKFTGSRPSLGASPTAKPSAKPAPGKHAGRMNWKPSEPEPEAKAPQAPQAPKLGKDRMKWKPPTNENAMGGTAPAVSVPDPNVEKEETADTAPSASPGPAATPSPGAASLFGA
jgi:hypothetical protein